MKSSESCESIDLTANSVKSGTASGVNYLSYSGMVTTGIYHHHYHPGLASPSPSTATISSPITASTTPGSSCCDGSLKVKGQQGPAMAMVTTFSSANNHGIGLISGPPNPSSPASVALYPSPISAYSPEGTYCSPPAIDPAAAFYPAIPGYGFKDGNWPGIPVAAASGVATGYYYDAPFAHYGYSHSPSAYDLNGAARRKNVTRDSTATLKAWLSEHRKNPYPTKGEKIMLAILTKMTLTQVSTWFANARRRLKKENKMTWEPRNRCDDNEEDGINSDSDDDSPINENNLEGAKAPPFGTHKALSTQEDNKGEPQKSGPELVKGKSEDEAIKVNSKPKIWSLADTAIRDKPKILAPTECSETPLCSPWCSTYSSISSCKSSPFSSGNHYSPCSHPLTQHHALHQQPSALASFIPQADTPPLPSDCTTKAN